MGEWALLFWGFETAFAFGYGLLRRLSQSAPELEVAEEQFDRVDLALFIGLAKGMRP